MRAWLAVVIAMLVPRLAHAWEPAINAGVVDVVAPTLKHVGAYPYVAVSMGVPWDHVFLASTVGVEWSPELGAWGFTGALSIDVPVAKRLGIDVLGSLTHDQAGMAWRGAAFYAGIGAGVSVFCDAWALSPSISAVHGINVGGWTLAPTFNVSRAF